MPRVIREDGRVATRNDKLNGHSQVTNVTHMTECFSQILFLIHAELGDEMIQKLYSEDIDANSLLSFSDDDFKELGELGLTLGKRKKIKNRPFEFEEERKKSLFFTPFRVV